MAGHITTLHAIVDITIEQHEGHWYKLFCFEVKLILMQTDHNNYSSKRDHWGFLINIVSSLWMNRPYYVEFEYFGNENTEHRTSYGNL